MIIEKPNLLRKYNVAAPRYTSYPTVPYWETASFNRELWFERLKKACDEQGEEGISLYIHLPFCENLCTYCGCNTRITKNHAVEGPYIDAVLKEWQLYKELLRRQPKIKELHLGGGTPTFFSPENLARLMKGILGENSSAECSFEGHPDNTTTAHLQTLNSFGFTRLSLGIQDFDPRVQFMINRFQTVEQVRNITEKAREMGYESVNYDLIYGLPGQTMQGLSTTISEVIALKPDRIAFYSYAHVPWMRPGQRHFSDADIPVGQAKFELYEAGKNALSAAGYEEIGMDHFALKKDSLYIASVNRQLHRNFMGYTHQHTAILIGLGVSSIGDCGTAFTQNDKTVEAYLESISRNEFAIERGHILTAEDLEIRRHILELMCHQETCFASEEIPLKVAERLAPMIQDRLVDVKGNKIQVTREGKSFLRNVCMALDERLWQKQPGTSLFSAAI